jgi:hypothetical protein
MATVLWIMFLSIFGLTAILTLASLPDWITIPEWYRKKLFVALILQVVGAVIILFKQSAAAESFEGTKTDTVYLNREFHSDDHLKAIKGREQQQWQIQIEKEDLGYVNLDINQMKIMTPSSGAHYNKAEPYRIGNSSLYFMIDSISSYMTDTLYTFYIKFGEGRSIESINWETERHQFYKTQDGRINLESDLLQVDNPNWRYAYYIGLGVGQPRQDRNSVDMLNIRLFQVAIK